MKISNLIAFFFLLFATLGWGQSNVSLPPSAGDGVSNDVIIGNNAARSLTGGGSNIFLGAYAGDSNVSGIGNVFLGAQAGQNNIGNANVFIGKKAGQNAPNVNHKLFIENTGETDNPLIYGDFLTDQVGIGTSHIPTDPDSSIPYTLAVNGKAIIEEVRVMSRDTWWPDYVFAEDYKLMPLADLETEIETLGHLPGVPSAEEVETNGHDIGRMDAILLEKIEELTLHLIDINKEVKDLRKENTALKDEVKALKK